jgi:hypothetical protein
MKTLTIDPMNVPRSGGGVPGSEGATAETAAVERADTGDPPSCAPSSPVCAAVAALGCAGVARRAAWPAGAVAPPGLFPEVAGLLNPDAAGYATTTSFGAD